MPKLANSGRDIVFIVPPDLFSHPRSKNTKNELVWLLENTHLARNVFLVFGAQDLLSSGWFKANTEKFKAQDKPKKKASILRDWRRKVWGG